MSAPAPSLVAVIAFDGMTPFHLSVPCLVFGMNRPGTREPVFTTRVCGADGRQLRTSAGFAIVPDAGLELLDEADIVVMPTWHDDLRPAPAPLLDALRRAHARGARMVGLCLGTFPLAEAGLLDGLGATTHWAYADALAQRYPSVLVDREVLYLDDGAVLTSAGVAAGLDCCLYLVRQLCGADVARHVARVLVVAPHRQGGQAQFIERPVPESRADDRFSQVLAWVEAHLDMAHSIDALAERAAMSRRNFTRHFRQTTGTSFKQWLLNQRVAYAQSILERSDAPLEVVAQQAGFSSALGLRQHFQNALRTSPSAYRKQFRDGA